jgi:TolB-like protein
LNEFISHKYHLENKIPIMTNSNVISNQISADTSALPKEYRDNFTKEEINEQVQKILADPIFSNSEILKRFLLFIVKEALAGRSNRLKEHTIGVNVLQKPVQFSTQECGIVRIHAGRLRRALKHYYNASGIMDLIHIWIPLGQYVPRFIGQRSFVADMYHESATTKIGKTILLSILPVTRASNDPMKNTLTESLGAQLTHSFIHLKAFSVITHYAIESRQSRSQDIHKLSSVLGAQWVVIAGIKLMNEMIRVSIQVNKIGVLSEFWNDTYEREVTSFNILKVLNEVIGMVITDLEVRIT